MGLKIDSDGVVRFNGKRTFVVECPTTISGLTVGAGEIGTTELATGAVTAAKLATDAVETAKIKDANVTVGKLATDAVETAKIKDANVTTAKLASGAVTLPKVTFTGLKVLAADGVNSGGGDTQVTLTGTAIGDRVIAIFGSVKVAHAGAFLLPVIGTDFESAITVTNKIVQKQAAADLSANTYIFIIIPAAA